MKVAICKAKLTVPEAAKLMEINQQTLRNAIENGDFPYGFGTVPNGSSHNFFWISAYDVLKHLGYDVQLKPVPEWLLEKEEAPKELAGSTGANE